MSKYLLIFLVLVVVLSVGKYKGTKAYFNDTATSFTNTFTTAESFSSSVPSISPSHVLINEVFPSGGSDSEWVELFNPTNSSIDLTGWKLHDNATNAELFKGSILLPAGGYAVVVASGSALIVSGSTRIETQTVTIGNRLSNDDDSLRLLTPDNNEIDALSWGADQSIFSGIATPSASQSIRRIPNGQDNDNANDWQVGIPSIGVSN
jgi:hypothetical protein